MNGGVVKPITCPITAEKISYSTNIGQSHCFQELDNRHAGSGP